MWHYSHVIKFNMDHSPTKVLKAVIWGELLAIVGLPPNTDVAAIGLAIVSSIYS